MAIAGTVRGLRRSPCQIRSLISQKKQWVFNPFGCSVQTSSYSSTSSTRRHLILYSKPGCCLCDDLKSALSIQSTTSFLHDVHLEVRDITTNAEWERAYRYEIPVLARVRADGTEERLPRLSTRSGAEYIQEQVAKALNQQNV